MAHDREAQSGLRNRIDGRSGLGENTAKLRLYSLPWCIEKEQLPDKASHYRNHMNMVSIC